MLVDLQNGDIGRLIGAHYLGSVLTLVGEHHLYLIGVLDHVVVGKDVSIFTHDHTGAKALGAPFPRHLLRHAAPEKLPEDRIVEHSAGAVSSLSFYYASR